MVGHDRAEIAFLAKEITIGNNISISMNKIFENKDAPTDNKNVETQHMHQPQPETVKLCRTCKRAGCAQRYYYSKNECERHVSV